jgi:hypothetical protein
VAASVVAATVPGLTSESENAIAGLRELEYYQFVRYANFYAFRLAVKNRVSP